MIIGEIVFNYNIYNNKHSVGVGILKYNMHSNDYSLLKGWPITITSNSQYGIYANDRYPVVGDIDHDGKNEVVLSLVDLYEPFVRLKVFILDTGGNIKKKFDIAPNLADYYLLGTGPLLADLDQDGALDIGISYLDRNYNNTWWAFYHANGSLLPGWPFFMSGGDERMASPIATDINKDGKVEVIASLYSSLFCLNATGGLSNGFPVINIIKGDSKDVPPLVADINGDSKLDIILATGPGISYTDNEMKICLMNQNGQQLFPPLRFNSPIYNNDNDNDSGLFRTHAVVGDIDGNGKTDVIGLNFGDSNIIAAWDIGAIYNREESAWPTYRHDNDLSNTYYPKGPTITGLIPRPGMPNVPIGASLYFWITDNVGVSINTLRVSVDINGVPTRPVMTGSFFLPNTVYTGKLFNGNLPHRAVIHVTFNVQDTDGNRTQFAYWVKTRGADDYWESESSMKLARRGLGLAVVNNKIYAIGGRTSLNSSSKQVEIYDPMTRRWSSGSSMLDEANGLSHLAVINNRYIYVIGGNLHAVNGGSPRQAVQILDVQTGRWTYGSNLPGNIRTASSVAVVNGKIYVLGGWIGGTGTQADQSIWEYNPATKKWIRKADMKSAKYSFATAVVNNKIYILGGRNGDPKLNHAGFNTIEMYDPQNNTCVAFSVMPTPRSDLCAEVTGNKIYVIGGRSNATDLSLNQCFDPITKAWIDREPLLMARSKASAGVYGGKIYVVGGYQGADMEGPLGGTFVSDLESYTPPANSQIAPSVLPMIATELTLTKVFNFPNPFGASGTKFSYELSQDADIEIMIFTNQGRKVKTIRVLRSDVGGQVGLNHVDWNGYDESGEDLPNNTYFYMVRAKNSMGEKIVKGKLGIMK